MKPENVTISHKHSNAWLVRLGEEASLNGHVLTIDFGSSSLRGIQTEDAMLVTEEREGTLTVIGVGRVFRKRCSLDDTSFYFDSYLSVSPNATLEDLKVPVSEIEAPINRLDWALFENALKTTTGESWASFPVIPGVTPSEQAYIRELMQVAIEDDLLGPADGPEEEIIGMSVRDRYLVGKLSPVARSEEPSNLFIRQVEDEQAENDEPLPEDAQPYANPDHVSVDKIPSRADDDEEEKEPDASASQSLIPSSFGFTFCVDSTVERIELTANWGRYERAESSSIDEKNGKPFRCWKRIPSGGKICLDIDTGKIEPVIVDERCPEVLVRGSISSPLEKGDRLVTLFLMNDQTMPPQNQDEGWVFQPELIVRDPEGRPIFRRRPVLGADGSDLEREALEMIYRKQVEFAVGHGISVHATNADNDNERAVQIETTVLPKYEVPITETPGLADEDRPAMKRMTGEGFLDMENLATLEK
ncbi:MAG TPA: helicase, partial [Candidatus Rifleibacterium sp.]|nr:helicase [Candidatus Rifleibacterium sp.]